MVRLGIPLSVSRQGFDETDATMTSTSASLYCTRIVTLHVVRLVLLWTEPTREC
jgi:hypothetical protein